MFPSWSWAGWASSGGQVLRWDDQVLSRLKWRDFSENQASNAWFTSDEYRSPRAGDPTPLKTWVWDCGYYHEKIRQILFSFIRPRQSTREYQGSDFKTTPTS